MKRLVLAFLLIACHSIGWAQSCGDSGASQCEPLDTLQASGFYPASTVSSPFVNGETVFNVIQFKAPDSIYYNNIAVSVDSIRIDSIGNLPTATCWSTNKATDIFVKNEVGCLKIKGFVCSDPGQYKLRILVTIYTPDGITGPFLNTEMFGLKYYIRTINNGDNTVAVDTNQTESFYKRPGYAAINDCIPFEEWPIDIGINEIHINNIAITPNPFTTKAVVAFSSERATVMTERLTNMLGTVVAKNTVNVKAGENSSIIDAANLTPGVYFYSLTDGKNSITKRVVISE